MVEIALFFSKCVNDPTLVRHPYGSIYTEVGISDYASIVIQD